MIRFIAIFPILIFLTLLLAVAVLGAAIAWEMGVVFGGTIKIFSDYALTSGHIVGAALVCLSLAQLVWGPMAHTAWEKGELDKFAVMLVMAGFCILVSFFTGIAWQYARVDLMARISQAELQKWDSSTRTIARLSASAKEIEPRGQAEIQAEIDVLLLKPIVYKRATTTVKAFSNGCLKDHYKTRRTCASVMTLRAELAKSTAYQARQKRLLEAEHKRDKSLQLNTAKFFEYFETRWKISPEDQINLRMLGLQGLVELLMLVLPLCLKWQVGYLIGPNSPSPTRRDSSHTNASHTHTLTVIEGSFGKTGAQKTQVLLKYIRTRAPCGWVKPAEFIDQLNMWCEKHEHRKFNMREVGSVWPQIGGEKKWYYVKTPSGKNSRRWLWRIDKQEKTLPQFAKVA